MSHVGDYDPNGFDPADQTTWPGWTGTDAVYDQGDWYYVDTPGTLAAQGSAIPATVLEVGDRIYPLGYGRLYGQGTYGSGVFGGPLQSPWILSQGAGVLFRPWLANTSTPWDRPAPPYAGCPFGPSAPGWRIVVEALILDPNALLRLYGDGTYGSDIYGGTAPSARQDWIDITPSAFGVVARRGGTDGTPVVPVDELQIDNVDLDADRFPLTIPQSWYAPGVGTMTRVSLLDPYGQAYPICVGRIERIDDVHDAPPRIVNIDAFGLQFEETHALDTWVRPSESARRRLAALQAAAGWQWSPDTIYPGPGDTLQAVDRVDVAVRAETDRTAISTGWVADVDVIGRLRFRDWPVAGDGPPIVVVDCDPVGGELQASSIRYLDDTTETVNYAGTANAPPPPAAASTGHAEDAASIFRLGRREGLGFPHTDLSTQTANLDGIARAAVDRYGKVTLRPAEIDVDLWRDPNWLQVLAELDTGRRVIVHRRAFNSYPLTLEGVIVGVEHRLTPNRWQATLYVSGITPTI